MNEHDRAILWKHDVRPSGDILHMQPESKTPRVKPALCISCCSRRGIGGCSIFYSKNSLRRILPRARPSFIAGVSFVFDEPIQLCTNR